MSEIQYQVYDFASSARVERPLWLAFHNWLEKCAQLYIEQWSNFSASPMLAIPMSIDAGQFEVLQARWTKPVYGVEVSFNDNATAGMLVIERVGLIRLMMDILGDTSTDEIEDRALTSVESSLCGLIFEQSTSVLAQSWPEQHSLTFSVGQPDDQPNRSKMFPPDKNLLTSGLQIQIADNTLELQLLLAKDETCNLLGVDTQSTKVNPDNKISREKIAEIFVQVTAGLGTSELGMSDLVSLSEGDIIVLDHFVEDPLVVCANDEPVFHAWPGRNENIQVLSIASPIN